MMVSADIALPLGGKFTRLAAGIAVVGTGLSLAKVTLGRGEAVVFKIEPRRATAEGQVVAESPAAVQFQAPHGGPGGVGDIKAEGAVKLTGLQISELGLEQSHIHLGGALCEAEFTAQLVVSHFLFFELENAGYGGRGAGLNVKGIVDGGVRVGIGAHIKTARFVTSEEHTSELQSRGHLVCRLLLETK